MTEPAGVARLLDLQDIQGVLALYAVALDSRAFALFDACVTPDARIFLPGFPELDPASYCAMLREFLPRLDATHHLIGVPVIRLDGGRAHSRCYFTAQSVRNALAPRACLTIGGWYTDELVRTAAGWRISRREGTALWSDGNPAVLDYPFMGAAARTAGHEAPPWLTPGG